MARHHVEPGDHPGADRAGSADDASPVVPLLRRGRPAVTSWADGHGRGRVLLGEGFDDEAVDRLGGHLQELLAGPSRFITIDATAVTACGPALIALLGRTQHRLEDRRGLLSVFGLRADLLPPEAADPTADAEVLHGAPDDEPDRD